MHTQNFQIPLLIQNQAMKEYTINSAINKIDSLINRAAISFVDHLPQDASFGDLHIIKSSSKLLAKYENQIIIFLDNSDEVDDFNNWQFIIPVMHTIIFVQKLEAFYLFNGKMWTKVKS